MTTTQVDNFDPRRQSLLDVPSGKGDHRDAYVVSIAHNLPWVRGDKPKPEGFSPKTHGVIEIIDHRAGDVKVIWDRTNADQTAACEAMFNTLLKKGYAAFLIKDNDGNKGEKITKWDPNAERVMMVAPMAGG